MAAKIKNELNSDIEEYEFNIEKPFFVLEDNEMILTKTGVRYTEDVNQLVSEESKQIDYKKLLTNYINVSKIRQHARTTDRIRNC